MRFKYTLEKYKTGKRYTCPNCGHGREFARYIDTQTGEYLARDVGKCNRDSKCGYHYTPRRFFADNPQFKTGQIGHLKKGRKREVSRQGFINKNALQQTYEPKRTVDFIEQIVLVESLANYDRNAFVQFLFSNFERADVLAILRRYFIGTFRDGRTVFWQVDSRNRIRTGKLIRYEAETGKRRKNTTNFVHAKLKESGELPQYFELRQCFFGEHLLQLEPEKPLAIVEAEKTAIIAAMFFPQYVWLATAGKSNLKAEKLERFAGRKIVLFPDADAFERWQTIAQEAREQRLNVFVSDLIERHGTPEEKQEGFDLADYLLFSAKLELEQTNAAIDRVLNDSDLLAELDFICEERAAILEIDGNVSNALDLITEPENLRQIALELAVKRGIEKCVAQ